MDAATNAAIHTVRKMFRTVTGVAAPPDNKRSDRSHDATKEYDAARSVVQEIRLGRARRDNTILIQDSAAGAIQLQQKRERLGLHLPGARMIERDEQPFAPSLP